MIKSTEKISRETLPGIALGELSDFTEEEKVRWDELVLELSLYSGMTKEQIEQSFVDNNNKMFPEESVTSFRKEPCNNCVE